MNGKRNILFLCTDQQRFDSLGCNGGVVARTPMLDGLAAQGLNFLRAHNQNVICMPSRATMFTGQLVRTHGVYASGIALPDDAPTVVPELVGAGYRTAMIGKAHIEPLMEEWPPNYAENRMALEGSTGPWRGFEHAELAFHLPAYLGRTAQHYGVWVRNHHPADLDLWPRRHFDAERLRSDTGAPDTSRLSTFAREHYHTDWVADRAIACFATLAEEDTWFAYVSFPDPHHPLNPPSSELHRVDWRDLDLPPAHPGSTDKVVEILSEKPRHWMQHWESSRGGYAPAAVTDDQIREINAMVHIEVELIDEAIGRILEKVRARGWDDRTDIFFSTDHGDLQGDLGMLFKGSYHVDGLMRLPFIWRPAPRAGIAPATIAEPVGLLDLAPTWCDIAGVPVPAFMQGEPLPTAPGSARERVITEFDSLPSIMNANLRSMYRDGYLCTIYEPSDADAEDASTAKVRAGLERVYGRLDDNPLRYQGDEGELYDLNEDPYQWRNRWDDPDRAGLRSDLVADLHDHLPPERQPKLPWEYMG
jgi:arylsulfatase A-like enzyme